MSYGWEILVFKDYGLLALRVAIFQYTESGDGSDVTVPDGGQYGGGEEHRLDEVPVLGEVLLYNTDTCRGQGLYSGHFECENYTWQSGPTLTL